MNKILLARSEDENEAGAIELGKLGFTTCCIPLISFNDLPYNFNNIPSHVIITSKHAAKLLSKNFDNDIALSRIHGPVSGLKTKQIEAWVVGEESAAILASNENIKVTGVAKNAKDLLNIISMIPEDEAKVFFKNSLYLSGNIITYELPSYIKRDIIYEVEYAKILPDEALALIKNKEISCIMICSKNSANNLIRILEKYNLLPFLKHSAVIGISKDVASVFNSVSSRILYSEQPSFSNMIKILTHENYI